MERLNFKAMALAVRGQQNPKSAGQAGDPEKRCWCSFELEGSLEADFLLPWGTTIFFS